MTANEMIAKYKAAEKFSSFRNKKANFKVQDKFAGSWRTLFCVADIIEARGWVTLRKSKDVSFFDYRIVGRDGSIEK